MKSNQVTPYKNRLSKKEQVTGMFNHIAHRYDFLNHLLSFGIDRIWRRKLIQHLSKESITVLDVATGTGDLAIGIARKRPTSKIVAVDIAALMLEKARKKAKSRRCARRIEFEVVDGEQLPYIPNSYDVVAIAFGLRNFEDVEKGLAEFHRVLKDEGSVLILEFSKPNRSFFGFLFKVYFKYIIPFIGKVVSGNRHAYTYLPESVDEFPHGNSFLDLMKKTGFENCKAQKLTFGVASLYRGQKVN